MFGWIMLAVWALTVVGWIIYNLYQKNIKLENTVISQANFIAGLQSLIGESEKAVKNLHDKILARERQRTAAGFLQFESNTRRT
jgi:hypothetical protein